MLRKHSTMTYINIKNFTMLPTMAERSFSFETLEHTQQDFQPSISVNLT